MRAGCFPVFVINECVVNLTCCLCLPDDGAENGGVLTPEEQAKLFLSANRSLQMQLAERHDLAVKAMESKRELQERVGDLQRDFERERVETFGITQDMTRQYKSMQEELLNRVNALENTNTELRDQLGAFILTVLPCIPVR